MITSMAQLDNYIEAANRHRDMMAVARMHAYVREAQLMSREERSPLQDEMEDTRLGACGRTFVCKSRRPQCTCWGEYTSDDGLA